MALESKLAHVLYVRVVAFLTSFASSTRAAVSPSDIIYAGIGFLLVGILTPIGLGTIYAKDFGGNTTNINMAVLTIFQILLPILYIIGVGLYFIPKIGK